MTVYETQEEFLLRTQEANDNPVIAQTESHRMRADGSVQSRTTDGMDWQTSWVWDKQDFADLLADLYRRVREDAQEEFINVKGEVVRLQNRIAAVEARKEGEPRNFLEALARVRSDGIEAEIAHQKYQNLIDRVSALEAHMPVPGQCPGEDMRDQLQARQQDEAGERAKFLRRMPDGSYEEVLFSINDLAEAGPDITKEIRRELAREIVERLRGMRRGKLTYDPTLTPDELERRVADWIEREYLESEAEGEREWLRL